MSCAYADCFLLAAFSAWCRRSRFLPRRDLLPDALVSASGASACGGRVLFRCAAGVHLRQSVVGFLARTAWRDGFGRLAVAVSDRGDAGIVGRRVGVLVSRQPS